MKTAIAACADAAIYRYPTPSELRFSLRASFGGSIVIAEAQAETHVS